jgi:hypothetical protein
MGKGQDQGWLAKKKKGRLLVALVLRVFDMNGLEAEVKLELIHKLPRGFS